MYLRDYLHDIPLKLLKVIAETLGITVEYNARIKLVNAIDRAFWDGMLVERLFKKLHKNHRYILALIAFSYDTGISYHDVLRKSQNNTMIGKAEVSKLINDLISHALIGGISNGEIRYFCLSSVAEQIRRQFLRDVISCRQSSHQRIGFTSPHLLGDIFSFMAEVYKEPIPLTLVGKVKRNILDKIYIGSLTCSDPSLHFTEEDRNTFIIDYLRTHNLITCNNNSISITNSLNGWLSLSTTDCIQDIVSFTLTYFAKDSSAITGLVGILTEISAESSFNMDKLTIFLQRYSVAKGSGKHLITSIKGILAVLSQVGLLTHRKGFFHLTEAGECFFHNRTLPIDLNPGTDFTTQANFEIIAGLELNQRVRFILELLTTRKQRDMVITYTLNQQGVARARERGMSTDDILQFLKDHSRNPLSQNVQFSVENWANSYGNISFETATLMRFRDASTCNNVFHLAAVQPYIKQKVSDTVIIVAAEWIPHITSVLKKAGYLPEAYRKVESDPLFTESVYIPKMVSELIEAFTMTEGDYEYVVPEGISDVT